MLQRLIGAGLSLLLVTSSVGVVVAQSDDKKMSRDELKQQRIEIRDQKRELLTQAKEERIVERCVAAQAKIQAVSDRADKFRENHANVYNSWITKASGFLSRLKEANPDIDSTKFDASLVELSGLIEEFGATYTEYQTQLKALATMDCVTNPQAFQNSLLTARDYRKAVVNALHSVRSYIQTNVKTELKAIKDQIVKDTDDGTEESEPPITDEGA